MTAHKSTGRISRPPNYCTKKWTKSYVGRTSRPPNFDLTGSGEGGSAEGWWHDDVQHQPMESDDDLEQYDDIHADD